MIALLIPKSHTAQRIRRKMMATRRSNRRLGLGFYPIKRAYKRKVPL